MNTNSIFSYFQWGKKTETISGSCFGSHRSDLQRRQIQISLNDLPPPCGCWRIHARLTRINVSRKHSLFQYIRESKTGICCQVTYLPKNRALKKRSIGFINSFKAQWGYFIYNINWWRDNYRLLYKIYILSVHWMLCNLIWNNSEFFNTVWGIAIFFFYCYYLFQ